jgi:adenylosuccinate lyase
VVRGLCVFPAIIQKNLREALPFLASEAILMHATARGGNRQLLHEKLRQLSRQAVAAIKLEGRENPLLELVAADPDFALSRQELEALLDPKAFAGLAPQQVEAFLAQQVAPWLAAHPPAQDEPPVEV